MDFADGVIDLNVLMLKEVAGAVPSQVSKSVEDFIVEIHGIRVIIYIQGTAMHKQITTSLAASSPNQILAKD